MPRSAMKAASPRVSVNFTVASSTRSTDFDQRGQGHRLQVRPAAAGIGEVGMVFPQLPHKRGWRPGDLQTPIG